MVGVPVSRPLRLRNVAQLGLLMMEKVKGSLLASEAVGIKLYSWPVVTVVVGEPLIMGAVLVAALTLVVNVAANDAPAKTRKISSRFGCCMKLPVKIRQYERSL